MSCFIEFYVELYTEYPVYLFLSLSSVLYISLHCDYVAIILVDKVSLKFIVFAWSINKFSKKLLIAAYNAENIFIRIE